MIAELGEPEGDAGKLAESIRLLAKAAR
jgi:hypothetical protein